MVLQLVSFDMASANTAGPYLTNAGAEFLTKI